MPLRLISSLFLVLLLIGSAPLSAQPDEESESVQSEEENHSPKFSRPSSGFGIGFGLNLTDLKPSTLDPDLSGDLVPTNTDVYAILQGLLLGLSWTSTELYDPGRLYDEFSYSYWGALAGYDHSLFYGKMTLRLSFLVGSGEITMIKKRPDITFDTAANPSGREVLERVREQEFFMIRPAFGIGYSPIDFLQFRTEVGFMYPSSDEMVSDLREPIYSLQIVFGRNR